MQAKVRHFVLEVRYRASLAVGLEIDKLGIDLTKDFPDWQRTPLTLELRNKKSHRRLYLSHARSFYDAAFCGLMRTEIDKAVKYFEKIINRFNIDKIDRLGVRQLFSTPYSESFSKLCAAISKQTQSQDKRLLDIVGGELEDILYAVNIKTPEGWKYNIKSGPMKREQWIELCPYEKNAFETDEVLAQLKSEIPEVMLFLDFDGFMEDVPSSELTRIVTGINKGIDERQEALAKYFLEKRHD